MPSVPLMAHGTEFAVHISVYMDRRTPWLKVRKHLVLVYYHQHLHRHSKWCQCLGCFLTTSATSSTAGVSDGTVSTENIPQ